MQSFENLLLQNYSTKFLDITSGAGTPNWNAAASACARHSPPGCPWVCVIKVCSNGGATYIISEIIAKDNLNIENLMQSFKNLLLQNYSTKFLDITYK